MSEIAPLEEEILTWGNSWVIRILFSQSLYAYC